MSRTKMYSSVNANKEKSSFSRTCDRLGLFLKEKGSSLKDLGLNANFDAIDKRESTVDLLSNMESPVQTSTKSKKTIINPPLPQYVSLDSWCEPEAALTNTSGYNETGTKTAPMTIFYGGQVLVFDDISDDKARDLMLLATGGSVSGNNRIQNPSAPTSPSNSSCDIFGSPELTIPRLRGLDLPIVRRASLHKFLARRKDRASVRPAPYQSSQHTFKAASSSTTHTFDLNF